MTRSGWEYKIISMRYRKDNSFKASIKVMTSCRASWVCDRSLNKLLSSKGLRKQRTIICKKFWPPSLKSHPFKPCIKTVCSHSTQTCQKCSKNCIPKRNENYTSMLNLKMTKVWILLMLRKMQRVPRILTKRWKVLSQIF